MDRLMIHFELKFDVILVIDLNSSPSCVARYFASVHWNKRSLDVDKSVMDLILVSLISASNSI